MLRKKGEQDEDSYEVRQITKNYSGTSGDHRPQGLGRLMTILCIYCKTYGQAFL